MQDLNTMSWRKSSHSDGGGNGADCVEISHDIPHIVTMRDSKRPWERTVNPPRPAWAAFLTALSEGHLTA
ncbi:DUF397 domain-containing protein [Streptomyces sp. NPDC052396]|uniref:DUF397 domain-containing protein n=1 Tax=Streptomyces sp. NPDC052396 TaxID=3365689 RepID=UPI0037D7798C